MPLLFFIIFTLHLNIANAKGIEIPGINEPVQQTIIMKGSKSIEVGFSPNGNMEAIIIHNIFKTKYQILVMASLLTSKNIANALINAAKRNVDVKVIMDPINIKLKHGQLRRLIRNHVPVWIDDKHLKQNENIMIIDKKNVLISSEGYTRQAKLVNVGNVIVLHDNHKLADSYAYHWIHHVEHTYPYQTKVTQKPSASVHHQQNPIKKSWNKYQDKIRQKAENEGKHLLRGLF